MQTVRHDAIRHHLYAHGTSSIQALADAIGASTATVRRDLQHLEQQGIVSRTHGGARIAQSADVEVAFEVREKQNLGAKRAIAEAAYASLVPQSSVFFDAGTTVLQLVRRLRVAPLPLTVFTNGLVVAQELMNVPKLKVTVIGGNLRSENASLIGPAAEGFLDRLWFDQLFLGANSIDADGRIYSVDEAEASLNARMQSRSSTTIVLADASKFGRRATYAVCDLRPPVRLITDRTLAGAQQERLRKLGLDLVAVEPYDAASARSALG